MYISAVELGAEGQTLNTLIHVCPINCTFYVNWFPPDLPVIITTIMLYVWLPVTYSVYPHKYEYILQ